MLGIILHKRISMRSALSAIPTRAKRFSACPGCRLDLSAVYAGARFCPACGKHLVHPSQVLRFLNFCSWTRPLALCFRRSKAAVQDAASGRAPIVIGYSNALFTLGWHYERGGGASRNLSEAARCYRKSARLGNLDAMVRLAVREAGKEPKRTISVNG
jgi:hypothetical protein